MYTSMYTTMYTICSLAAALWPNDFADLKSHGLHIPNSVCNENQQTPWLVNVHTPALTHSHRQILLWHQR